MEKKVIICLVLAVISLNLFSQGFKKSSNTEKIGSYELGNYHLYRHQADSIVVYSFDMRDKKYTSDHFLQVKLGTKEEAIAFFKNAIEAIDTMKKGDRFELGLPDGNVGFYTALLGVKKLGITVGDIGEYGELSKPVAKSMLKQIEKE